MTPPIRRLIDAKAQDVILEEGFARDLAEVAYALQQDGHNVVAGGMLNLSRHHRVRGMKARAEIAMLLEGYRPILDEKT